MTTVLLLRTSMLPVPSRPIAARSPSMIVVATRPSQIEITQDDLVVCCYLVVCAVLCCDTVLEWRRRRPSAAAWLWGRSAGSHDHPM
eukprot:COSAG01_NODE_1177_length_11372_cov_4.507851_2_plen_87_part_00